MSLNIQQLIQSIVENNTAGPGGAFGPTNALTTDPDVKTAMAIAMPNKKIKKGKKKNKIPLIRRTLPKGL